MDEKGEYQLSNFHGKHHKGRVTESDHAMVQLHMNLQFVVQKPQRTEAFNFKILKADISLNTQQLTQNNLAIAF